MQLIWKA